MSFSKKNIANYKHCKKVHNDLGLELMRWQVDRLTGSSLEVHNDLGLELMRWQVDRVTGSSLEVHNDLGLELMRWQVDRVTGSSFEVGKFAQRYKDEHDQEPKTF